MSRLSLILFTLTLLLFGIPAFAQGESETSARAQIQTLFNQLQIAGGAYNAQGGSAAFDAALGTGCSTFAGTGSLMMNEYLGDRLGLANPEIETPQGLMGFAGKQAHALSGQLMQGAVSAGFDAACAAIAGNDPLAGSGNLLSRGQDQLMLSLVSTGQMFANTSGLPFMGKLELETALERDEIVSTITTVQPLWTDKDGMKVLYPGYKPPETSTHHIFTQMSWRRIEGEGTLNTGLAYRHLNDDKTMLWGLNAFFDHGFERNHNRMSIGADVKTSTLGVSANRYIGLSGWRDVDAYIEERAADGWDVEVNGQVPALPSWTASLTGYQWDGQDHVSDNYEELPKQNTFGYVAAVEYAPVPALAVRAGMREETDAGKSGELALRFNLRFDEPLALQFKPRLQLASMEERIYEKVSRENTIRVEQRRKDTGILTVIESIGGNRASGQPGIVSLRAGKSLIMPLNLTVANTPGAVARLRFRDGAILTAGQGTQLRIEAEAITLVAGSAQYVSGSTVRVVNTPGATITLLGTDIDIYSGIPGSSSVRVRDGAVRMVGTANGTETIQAGGMGESVNGVVGTVAVGSPSYITHTDTISAQIDRVAQPITGQKIAPYPADAPFLVATTSTPGQPITVGVRFNTAVQVAGGTPSLNFKINGVAKTAALSSGSGTNILQFSYTMQVADVGANTITVTELDLNGATITGEGKTAVTTIADTTLDLSDAVGTSATLVMDFINDTYSLLGNTYNTLSALIAATGGSFDRNSIGTYFDSNGVLQTASIHEPRFGHDPVTHQPKGLMIEDQRTNNLINSNDPGSWQVNYVSGHTVGALVQSPDGTNNARRITLATGGYYYGISNSALPPGEYTASAWLKGSPGQSVGFRISNTGNGANQAFTTVALTNAWQRIAVSFTLAGTVTIDIGIDDRAGLGGVGTGAVVDMFGGQIEAGAFATSYIPTGGSTVTRSTDQLFIPTATWYNQSAGTFATDVSWELAAGAGYPMFWRVDDGTYDNRWNAYYAQPTTQVGVNGYVATSWQGDFHANKPVIGEAKIATAQELNNTIVAFDGNLSALDNSWTTPTVNELVLDGWNTKHYVRALSYYPSRLPDATLQTLSTP
jgi:hypothetical protein